MEQIIWKVKLNEGAVLERGRHVTCLWNREKRSYEVYFRGNSCGIVALPWWEERTTPDFVLGEVIACGHIHARIRICRSRARSKAFVVNRLFLPAGAGAAA